MKRRNLIGAALLLAACALGAWMYATWDEPPTPPARIDNPGR